MRFTISRTSDSYRDIKLPDKNIRPHPRAMWDENSNGWIVNLLGIESILGLINEDESIILTKNGFSHIEIDDVSQGA